MLTLWLVAPNASGAATAPATSTAAIGMSRDLRITASSFWGCGGASDAISQSPVAAVTGDDEQNECAEDDLLVGLAVALADQDRGQDGEDQRPDHGVAVVAARAHEGRPADDDGRQAAEEVWVADRLVSACEPGEQHANQRREDCARGEDDDPHARGAHARERCGPRVRAGGEELTARHGAVEDHGGHDGDADPDRDDRRDLQAE